MESGLTQDHSHGWVRRIRGSADGSHGSRCRWCGLVSWNHNQGEENGPRGYSPAGPWPVQLRYESGHTGEEYVSAEAWCAARLERCPNHSQGGCSFARHGTYPRKTPVGTRIARWYCPESHTTFSLLPDCLAARLPGTLKELEAVVAVAEQTPSLIKAADKLRPDAIELAGAMRWVQRRVRSVHHALRHVVGLLPEQFARCNADVAAFRKRLGTKAALLTLRSLTAVWLPALPAPLGFRHHGIGAGNRKSRRQHNLGPAPPAHPP